MNITKRSLFILPLILLFFPAFCIWVSVKPIVIYYIISSIVFSIVLIFYTKPFIKKIIFIYKHTPFKYYSYFALWVILSGLFLVFRGGYNIKVYLYYMVSLLLICHSFSYLIPAMVFGKKDVNIRFFAKLFCVIYYIIFIIAVLEFLGICTGQEWLCFPSEFFGNQRFLSPMNVDVEADRVKSIFAEPGWLGGFIGINLPIIYKLGTSKYKIFKNVVINKLVKYTMIPLTWVTILVAQSAIWLVFCLLITMIYNLKNIYRIIVKHFFVIFGVLILLAIILIPTITFLNNNTKSLGYYARIFTFFKNILSFDAIVMADQSLGTRLVSYVLCIQCGIKHWLLGVGLGNLQYVMPKIFFNSHMPYVGELWYKFNRDYTLNRMDYSGVIPYQFFAETGAVGLFLFYRFIYKSIIILKHIKNRFFNIEYDFAQGVFLAQTAAAFIIFYDIPESYYIVWFLYGLTNIFLLSIYMRDEKCPV